MPYLQREPHDQGHPHSLKMKEVARARFHASGGLSIEPAIVLPSSTVLGSMPATENHQYFPQSTAMSMGGMSLGRHAAMQISGLEKGVITKGVFSLWESRESLKSLKPLDSLGSLENGRILLCFPQSGYSLESLKSLYSLESLGNGLLRKDPFSNRPLFPNPKIGGAQRYICEMHFANVVVVAVSDIFLVGTCTMNTWVRPWLSAREGG